MNLPTYSDFAPLWVEGRECTFDHLRPIPLAFPTKGKPTGVRISVEFSCHCFSETFDPAVHTGEVVYVVDGEKKRVFSQSRYDLSTSLPQIVRDLPTSAVFLTPEANFVRITALIGSLGVEYRVFFRIARQKKFGR